MLAISSMRARFSSVVARKGVMEVVTAVPAFPLAAICGTLGPSSALAVEGELSLLAARGEVLVARMGGEVAAILSEDLDAYLQKEMVTADTGEAAASLQFFAFLARRHGSSSHVTDADVESSHAAWVAAGRPRDVRLGPASSAGAPPSPKRAAAGASRGSGRAASAASAAAAAVAAAHLLPDLRRALLQRGLLQRRGDTRGAPTSSSAYHFGVPAAGRLVAYLAAGRAELLARLSRAPGRQMRAAEVLAMRLARSSLATEFHVRDALGRGLLLRVGSASGDLFRPA
jgi:hypothetical protein